MSFDFSTTLKPFTSIPFASAKHNKLLTAKSPLHNSASASTFSPPPTRQLSPDFTSKQLLHTLRLQNDETSALRIFEWASKQPNFAPISSVYEEILRKLGKVGSFESIGHILEEMKLAGSEVRTGTFLILIKSYARFGFYDEILGVVEMMEVDFGLKPNRSFYNCLLNVLVNGDELELVETAYSAMVGRGIEPDGSTFRILIKGLCRAHQIRPAILMMEEMLSHGLSPDKKTVGMLMHGCLQEGYLDGTLRVREKLLEAGYRIQWSSVTVNLLVSRFFEAGRIGEALSLLRSEGFFPNGFTGSCKAGLDRHPLEIMDVWLQEGFDPGICNGKSLLGTVEEDRDCSPTSFSYDTLISTLCRQNQIEEAAELARALTSMGIVHNVFTFNILIHGLCKTSNHGIAMELFEEMKTKGCQPDVFTYNILIDSLCSMQRFEEAKILLKEMDSSACARNVVTYNTLISWFCKNKWVEEAEVIFGQMEQQGVLRNLVTYNTLIDGLCKSRRVKDAVYLMDKMVAEGLKPNQLTYNSLLTYFCRTGNIKKAANVIRAMTSNGCEPDIVTYNTLIGGLCKVGKNELDAAIRILRVIETKGMVPTPHTYNPIIHSLFRRRRRVEAMKLFKEMMERGDPPNAVTYNIVFRGHCNVGGPIREAVDIAVEMMGKGFVPEFSSFFMLAEGLCALSMEKTLAKLVATLMEKANLSDGEVSMIKGFLNIHKFRDGLLTLGGILNSRNSKRAN